MSIYVKKLIGYFSNPEHRLGRRSELSDFVIDEKEYFNNFLKYEVSFLKKLRKLDFHTADYTNTGTYDFHFGIQSVELKKYITIDSNSLFGEVVRLYINISPEGTVEIYNDNDDMDLYEINDSLISNHKEGWEINNEISDIIREIVVTNLPEFVSNTRLIDIVELYINYPLD